MQPKSQGKGAGIVHFNHLCQEGTTHTEKTYARLTIFESVKNHVTSITDSSLPEQPHARNMNIQLAD